MKWRKFVALKSVLYGAFFCWSSIKGIDNICVTELTLCGPLQTWMCNTFSILWAHDKGHLVFRLTFYNQLITLFQVIIITLRNSIKIRTYCKLNQLQTFKRIFYIYVKSFPSVISRKNHYQSTYYYSSYSGWNGNKNWIDWRWFCCL